MYTYEQRAITIETYLSYHGNITATIRKLGYPNSHRTLYDWIKDYIETSYINITTTRRKNITVNTYISCGGNYSKAIKIPGYPSKSVFRSWVEERVANHKPFPTQGRHTSSFSYDEKIEALKIFLTRDTSAEEIARKHLTTRISLYN